MADTGIIASSLMNLFNSFYVGGMAERLNAAVLKTVVPQGTVGSNPTSSAILWRDA